MAYVKSNPDRNGQWTVVVEKNDILNGISHTIDLDANPEDRDKNVLTDELGGIALFSNRISAQNKAAQINRGELIN